MSHDIKTRELAKIYENQGYYKDAYDMYLALDSVNASSDIKAALNRLGNRLGESTHSPTARKEKLAALFEKWVKLLILKQRLINFKKIKTRLS